MELSNYIFRIGLSLNPNLTIRTSAMSNLIEIFQKYTNFFFHSYETFSKIIDVNIINFILQEGYSEHNNINCYFHSEMQILKDIFKEKNIDFIKLDHLIINSQIFYSLLDKKFKINRNALIIYHKHVETYFLNFMKLCLKDDLIDLNGTNYAENLVLNKTSSVSLISTNYTDLIPYIKKDNEFILNDEVCNYVNLFLQNLLIKVASYCLSFNKIFFPEGIANVQSLILCLNLIFRDEHYSHIVNNVFISLSYYRKIQELVSRNKKAGIKFNVYCVEQLLSKFFDLNDFTVELRVAFAIILHCSWFELYFILQDNDELDLINFKEILREDKDLVNIFRRVGLNLEPQLVFSENITENFVYQDVEFNYSELVTEQENQDYIPSPDVETIVDPRILEIEREELLSMLA